MPMQRVGKKADALSKVEFHRRLREWFLTTGEKEKQIGPGEVRYILIYNDEKYYWIHSDAKRWAVREYLSLVDLYGDSIQWTLGWTQKKKFTLVKVGPQAKTVESLLLYSELEGNPEIDSLALSSEDADDSTKEASKLDPRQLVNQQIRRRRGQRKFRDALRKRYHGTCVVTGCKIVDLLEAAHIRTMPGIDDNCPENGLLLRADIHTLFDLNLLWVEADTLQVCLHPSIANSEYASYAGQTLRDQDDEPLTSKSAPSSLALRERWHAFK